MQSGVSKVPNELLAEIFKLSIPEPLVISPHITSDDLPWALFGICKRWRHIVTEIPELWTKVIIEYEDEPLIPVANTSDPKYVTRIAQETLLRSGNAPLSLKLNSRKYNMDDQTPLINLVVNHSHRIKNLSLVLFEDALRNLLSMPPLNFDCLEFVSISCYDGPDEEIACSVFDNAPLKFAELQLYEWMPKLTRSRSTNLTYLSISMDFDLTPEGVHKILKQLPGLIFLQISLSSTDDEPVGTGSSSLPAFPSLQTLFVNSSEPELLPDFFKPLILPHLTRLEITPSGWAPGVDNSAWDCSAVFTVVSSFRQLNTFKITLPISGDYDMGSFLSTLPDIVNLGLPEISQPTLRSIYSGELVSELEMLQIPGTPQTITTYLDAMKNRLGGDFLTQLITPAHKWEAFLEADPTGEMRRLVGELSDQGLLEVKPYLETYIQMEECLPSDSEMWG